MSQTNNATKTKYCGIGRRKVVRSLQPSGTYRSCTCAAEAHAPVERVVDQRQPL